MKLPFFAILLGVVFCAGCAGPVRGGRMVERLKGVERWGIVLNHPNPEMMETGPLEPFQMMIFDPDHSPAPERLPSGMMKIAYVSVGEAESYRPYWGEIEGKEWVLPENPDWGGNFPVDVRSAEWRRVLLEREIPRVLAKGYDGLFLDTLDTGPELQERGYEGAREGMLELVRGIRRRFPRAVLIANNGLELLPELAAPVDGFLIEHLRYTWNFETKRTELLAQEERRKKIRRLSKHPEKPVFVLEYAREPWRVRRAFREARELGWRPYAAPIGLDFLRTDPPEETAAGEEKFPRTILALYDSTEGETAEDFNPTHRNGQMPLEYLGCVVRHHDIASGFPSQEEMRGVRGILSWFTDDTMPGAVEYCRWLARQVDRGVRLVVMEEFGAMRDSRTGEETPRELVDGIFARLGLRRGDLWTDSPLDVRTVPEYTDPDWAEFERTLEGETGYFSEMYAVDPRCRVLLRLEWPDRGGYADAVVVCPRGGYVQTTYAVYENPDNFKRQWRVNPFRFFREAFALAGSPRPDVTTKNGRRVWFSHIDGDGEANPAQDRKRLSIEAVRDEVLKRYPFPFTVSVVTSRIDPDALGSRFLVETARSVFALPNVEPASHSYAHPQNWKEGVFTGEDMPGYGGREWLKKLEFDLRREIVGSIGYIRKELVPEGKSVPLFLWTGSGNPSASTIRIADEAGLLNMNGGDPRMDRSFPSYTQVSPLVREQGDRIQVYAAGANENIYTNGFTEPLYGFRHVLDTFRNTETPEVLPPGRGEPRRVKPVNVYFHYYIASKKPAFDSLFTVLDETTSWEIAPVFASEYVRSVRGFLQAQTLREGDGRWIVRGYGECRTVRFDRTEGSIDLAQSSRVMGFRRTAWGTYVHLDEGGEARIVWTDSPDASTAYLEQSSLGISRWSASPDRIRFRATGYGKGVCRIAGLPPGSVWKLQRTGEPEESRLETVDEEGGIRAEIAEGEYELDKS